MRIKDFSWTHTIGKRPNVELYLFDVTSDELTTLRNLAAKGDKIKIEPIEYSKSSDFIISTAESSSIDLASITPKDIVNYARRDVEMTAALYGRSKIEFTPIKDIKVEKVIFNKPATIVFWSDNTKTVVVCGKDDVYDKEKGFYIACTKKLFGNNFKAIGRMNKALEKAIVQTKEKDNDQWIKGTENEAPHGEWLWLGFDDGNSHKWSCSKCGRGVKEQENFCPNCGLKMQKEGANNEQTTD